MILFFALHSFTHAVEECLRTEETEGMCHQAVSLLRGMVAACNLGLRKEIDRLSKLLSSAEAEL